MTLALASRRTALTPPWVRDPLWLRARAVPTLDLRFADSKSLTDAVTGASLVTFTRASSGTYVDSAGLIKSAATDAPRFDHNPVTGESLGLLVEESRTNLVLRSEEFNDASWTKSNITISANSVSAPNGTVTADTLTDSSDGAAAAHSVITLAQSFTSGLAYTISVYAQAGSLAGIAFIFPSAAFTSSLNARFNISTGTIQNLDSGLTGSITAVGGGWYRCSATATATATASNTIQIRTATASSSFYQGGGTGTVYIWGAQLEAGAFPTSYIPTTTAAVTRSADVASITGSAFSSWYRQDEGTFLSHYAPGVNGARPFFASNSDQQERFEQRTLTGYRQGTVMLAGVGISEYADTTRSFVAGTAWKHATAQNGTTLAVGSEIGVTQIAISRAPSVDRMWIGSFIGTGTFLNGTIRRLTYWNQRLANSTLQNITL